MIRKWKWSSLTFFGPVWGLLGQIGEGSYLPHSWGSAHPKPETWKSRTVRCYPSASGLGIRLTKIP